MDEKMINIDKIKPDKSQPRRTFDKEKLKLLAESILSNGLIIPIDVDENYEIINGERRWRAHKIAKIDKIPCRIIKLGKDKTEKLKRQLIVDIQNEEIPTGERYEAIVRLYKLLGPNNSQEKLAKELGISQALINSALDYCDYSEKEPELIKTVSPHIISETKSLPTKERKKVLKEFKGTKDKRRDLIRDMVKEKRQEIKIKEMIKEGNKNAENDVIICRTEETLQDFREQISKYASEIDKGIDLIGDIQKIKKLYLSSAKDKEDFFKFLRNMKKVVDRYSEKLGDLIDNLELEVIKE